MSCGFFCDMVYWPPSLMAYSLNTCPDSGVCWVCMYLTHRLPRRAASLFGSLRTSLSLFRFVQEPRDLQNEASLGLLKVRFILDRLTKRIEGELHLGPDCFVA